MALPGGLVELLYFAGPAEFRQCPMQPELLWVPNHRTPFRSARRGRTERLRRNERSNLNGRARTARNELSWIVAALKRIFCWVRCILRCIHVSRIPCFDPTRDT